jgi:hypothetical protein
MVTLFCLRPLGHRHEHLVQTLGTPLGPTRSGLNRVLSGSLKCQPSVR